MSATDGPLLRGGGSPGRGVGLLVATRATSPWRIISDEWCAANGSWALAAPVASRPPRPSTGGVAVYCRREPSRDARGSLSRLRASGQADARRRR